MLTPDQLESLETLRKETVEKQIIASIAESKHVDTTEAARIYYNSRIASLIANGDAGVQYLDSKNLADEVLADAGLPCRVRPDA